MINSDTIRAHCRTCMFWRQGHPPIATATRIPDPQPDLGICEYRPPTIHVVGGAAISLYPSVHADRCCWEWEPEGDYLPDGPDGGVREPNNNVVLLRDAA